MLEKRQAIRYHVGEGTDIVVFRDGGNLVVPLVDLSYRGLMIAMPESECRKLAPGREICGQIRRTSGVTPWRGYVVHRSPARCGIGIGVAFDEAVAAAVRAAVFDIVQQPDAGGLCLRRRDEGLVLEVHGRLSFLASRDALSYIRRDAIACIDLTHCSSVDSSGLGMLCLARDRRIAISGARGPVESLLAIARITEAGSPVRTAEMRLH